MKVFWRIVIKTLLLLLVISLAGAASAGIQGYRQSSADYAMETYLSALIDNQTDEAYRLLDQSENEEMTRDEYEAALRAGQYSLSSSCEITETESRNGTSGEVYTDYQVNFLNASGEVRQTGSFTAKKQEEAVFGLFDQWKILSGHCMTENFRLTVPSGSTVYLNGEEADAAWLTAEGVSASADCYEIPSLLPGSVSLVIRHPALESVNTTLDPSEGSADYTGSMTLKSSAQAEAKELVVEAMKAVYAAAATEDPEGLENVFADCLEEAQSIAQDQAARFHEENVTFQSVGVYDFDAVLTEQICPEDGKAVIVTTVRFPFSYLLREEILSDTEEVDEDGMTVQQTQTDSAAGETAAEFELSWEEDGWHIMGITLPVIPA